METDTRADLIGFALATAVKSLQQSDAIREAYADDIDGMLRIIEEEYTPETAAAFFWSSPGNNEYSVALKSESVSANSSEYWRRHEEAFNALTADALFGEMGPVQSQSNVIDFMPHLRRSRAA